MTKGEDSGEAKDGMEKKRKGINVEGRGKTCEACNFHDRNLKVL
jgi:hypothetical protein